MEKTETVKASIKKNFIMNFLLTASSFIFPLITFPYVSRVLLPEGVGKVAFSLSLISYFNMFAQLGIPTYGVRACATVRDDREKLTRTAHELLMINLIMSALSYFVLACALFFVKSLREDKTLYVLVSTTILLTTVGMEWLYKALEQYTYITIRSVFFKFIALIAMFALIHGKDDYVIYGFISIFAASASNIVNLLNARKYIDWKWMGNYSLKRHLKPVAIFFAMACAAVIYTNLDEVMLGFMTTKAEVGYYDAAVKVKKVLVSLVTSMGVVILPRASYYIEQGKREEFWNIGKKALNFVFLIALPIVAYFVAYATETIRFLAGPAFNDSVGAMQIIIPTVLFIGITNILGIQIMVPLGREKTVVYSEVIGAIVDLILNAILIPRFGAAGAAIGTLAAEIAVLVYQYIALRDEIGGAIRRIGYWKIILSTMCATLAAVSIKAITNVAFIRLAASAAVFSIVYISLILLLKESLAIDALDGIKRKFRKQGP